MDYGYSSSTQMINKYFTGIVKEKKLLNLGFPLSDLDLKLSLTTLGIVLSPNWSQEPWVE